MGHYLVIENGDAAGNETSTLLIVNNTNTVTVDLRRAGLTEFDFSSIDLCFAPQASLTLTAADLEALDRPGSTAWSSTAVRMTASVWTMRVVRANRKTAMHVYTLTTGTVLVDEDIVRTQSSDQGRRIG